MKKLILIIVILAGFSLQAQTSNTANQEVEVKKSKNKKVEFHVDGNCEMCKKRIEKAAISVAGVKSADWHMDCGTLYLMINEEKTNLPAIQKAIAAAGHDNDGIKASQEEYDKLHGCCLYERK